jgi:hypothetical protein
VQASGPDLLGLRIVSSFEGRDRRGGKLPPRYNAAPSQELWAIRQHPDTGERTLDGRELPSVCCAAALRGSHSQPVAASHDRVPMVQRVAGA